MTLLYTHPSAGWIRRISAYHTQPSVIVLKPSTSTGSGETTGAAATHEVPGDIQAVLTVLCNTQDSHMNCIPGPAELTVNAIGPVDTAISQLDVINIGHRQTLRTLSTVANGITRIHPYAQKGLQSMPGLDTSIVTTIEQTYELVLENGSSLKINATKNFLVETTQVVQECAQFITKYSETTTFWTWPGKSVLSETTTKVVNYNQKLKELMERCEIGQFQTPHGTTLGQQPAPPLQAV
ncbi:hypothetical protein SCLCIDRAFT_33521 [Scleroderma citrinum Foug A]|uniref:Uncharacterized protein n=1 Tax=Scleroderma citrinum Foug A TaxID=1036808 RepID=A0A0C2ZEH2_9AGAM|nr:hypothetical protein SCLCIDRAFT_33521 [Scleroderma citrinum Foug A]